MEPFVHEQLAARVVFGTGRLDTVPEEVARLGVERVLLIADPPTAAAAEATAAALGGRCAARWSEIAQHVPADLVARARASASTAGIDGIVSIGGGSSTGLAKAIALSHRVPIVAVPTTYAGSEQTSIYGITAPAGDVGRKETGRDPVVAPRTVVYDPMLTLGLPVAVTGPSAFNALAHAVEALYATGANPVVSALALEGVRAVSRALPNVMAAPHDIDARGDLLYGAYLCGVALGATSAGFHHKICHVLGGMFDLVHADAHSVVLPHAIAFNTPAIPRVMGRLADALGAPDGDAAGALWDLAVASDVPIRLADLRGRGRRLQPDDLDAAARNVAAEPVANPRPYDVADVRDVLERAALGARPSAVAAV